MTEVTASCQILLRGLEVMADIGALASERGVPQPLTIDAAVTVALPNVDELARTLDYTVIRSFALALAAERIILIETFARRLAEQCLDQPGVTAVEVQVGKPRAVPGCLAGSRVTLWRG